MHTSGTQTATGAQATVEGRQTVIPTSGTTAHRGRGTSTTTCTYRSIDVANPIGGTGAEANPRSLPAGTQVWRSCFDTSTGARVSGPTLVTTSGPSPATEAALGAQLVDEALANIDINLPTPHLSPPAETFPNFDTWFWTDEPPAETASASAAGVTVTVTATHTSTAFHLDPADGVSSPDDGVTITCSGTQHAYDPARPSRDQSTTCHHRFAAPTRDLTIGTTTTWHLTWTATNGTRGDLGTVTRPTTTPYRVQVEETVIRTPNP